MKLNSFHRRYSLPKLLMTTAFTLLGLSHLNLHCEPSSPLNSNQAQNSTNAIQNFTVIIEKGQTKGGTQTIRVPKGSEVSLNFSSDTDGVVHLHAYHLELALNANQDAQLKFNAKASGKFRVEWHPKLNSSTQTGTHEGPPLISLEVMPL